MGVSSVTNFKTPCAGVARWPGTVHRVEVSRHCFAVLGCTPVSSVDAVWCTTCSMSPYGLLLHLNVALLVVAVRGDSRVDPMLDRHWVQETSVTTRIRVARLSVARTAAELIRWARVCECLCMCGRACVV